MAEATSKVVCMSMTACSWFCAPMSFVFMGAGPIPSAFEHWRPGANRPKLCASAFPTQVLPRLPSEPCMEAAQRGVLSSPSLANGDLLGALPSAQPLSNCLVCTIFAVDLSCLHQSTLEPPDMQSTVCLKAPSDDPMRWAGHFIGSRYCPAFQCTFLQICTHSLCVLRD